MTLFLKAYRLLDERERKRAWLLLGVVLTVAIFETLGTVSVMPFLAVLANPRLIDESRVLSSLHDFMGFTDSKSFLVFLGIASFCFLLLSAAVRIVGQFMVIRFTQRRAFSIGRRLLEAYLRRPYAYYLTRHSGDMSQSLLSEVNLLIVHIYQPITILLVQGVLLLMMGALLVAVDPVVAIVGLGVLGGCYGAIYLGAHRALDRTSAQRMEANRARFRLVSEAIGGIKPVKLLGREVGYLGRFSDAAMRMARSEALSQTVGQVPRYAIEAVAFGGILLLAIVLMLKHGTDTGAGLGAVLPLLGVYAFAGYRMMPAIQGIYQAFSQLRLGVPTLNQISADLDAARDLPSLPEKAVTALPFHDEIVLDQVTFRHEGAALPSLQDISLTIPSGTTLGIVGSTGAGKTTLVDVFLGLLVPEAGEIRVDGVPVATDNLRSWQANLGYVPQEIFLLDASVAENIAFGVPKEDIDLEQVRACARMAQIHDFVTTELADGYDSAIGERGVRLSGGQRQRVGIARALYNNPSVLVFDEATSALDNVTERGVVEAIDALTASKTILIVAHRLSTVKDCDRILVLDHGRVAGLGSYADLYRESAAFRSIVDARDTDGARGGSRASAG